MTANRRRGLGLLILFAGFVGMAVLLSMQERSINETAERTVEPVIVNQVVFEDLSSRDIAAIRLADPNSTVSLDLALTGDTQWMIPSQPESSVDQQTATLIARTLAILPYEHAFDLPADSDLAQYGFRSDGVHVFSIQFVTVEGEPHFVAIGNPVEDADAGTLNSTFYAIVDDREQMYLIPQAAIFYLIEQMHNPPLE